MVNTAQLEKALGYEFRNRGLLVLALTHPSLAHEAGVGPLQQHNQRLEFLGDAVLQLAITAELYHKFPLFGEGPLTQARAQMVNRISLAAQGRRLKLGEYLILSRGEETTGGRVRSSTLADAFEAVIGAVFLDAGYETTGALIIRLFRDEFGELIELPNLTNPKGELQEFLQAKSPEPPHYEQVSVSGPDHVRQFECAVFHGGVELARGLGSSKKLAESAAALEALRRLKGSAPVNPAETTT
ncbi:MAG TPA: ribonuclease III [Verrucomicrobiota bacterium]|nr:ribonuclease III [Verrucomicrobiota bacterium]